MRSVRFAKLFSLPFSCCKSAATVSVAVWKRRRSSGSTYILHSAHNSVCFPLDGALKRRCSAACTPSGFALAGICRRSSARKGSSSEISMWSSRRRICISARLLQGGEQEVTMQLLHIQLGPLAHSAPQNRPAFLMHFQHMPLCFFAWITENPLENHRHVTHQVHRIIVHHHLPRNIELVFRTRFLFDRRLRRGHCSRLLVRGGKDSLISFDLCLASSVLPWPATHGKKANIRGAQFKQPAAGIGDAGSWRFILAGLSIPATVAQDFCLHFLHSARAGLRSIIESIQM